MSQNEPPSSESLSLTFCRMSMTTTAGETLSATSTKASLSWRANSSAGESLARARGPEAMTAAAASQQTALGLMGFIMACPEPDVRVLFS